MTALDVRPLWLCVDPGETTGFSLWDGDGKLLWADQLPMWNFIDAVYQWVTDGLVPKELCGDGSGLDHLDHDLKAMICEEWQLYPWELQNLAWDKCRTARAIGALTLICRRFGVELIFQGADIKEGAKQAGAEALYLEPVHENRHANDSIQHGVFYLAVNGTPPC
jgi:hypothetical protein